MATSSDQETEAAIRTDGPALAPKRESNEQLRKKDGTEVPSSTPTTHSAPLQGWRLYTVQACLGFSLMLSALDASIVATALLTIGEDFNNFVLLQWVVLSYMLTYLGFALIFARLSDVIGRKWTTIVSLVILIAFSLGCGLAQTLEQLIAFRALQGLGGSGLYAMPLTALPEITPGDKFPMMSAMLGAVFAISSVLGPTLGGVITTQSTWRWCFLFNVPCGILIIIVILFAWPPTQSAGRITWRQLDVGGCLLFLAASVLLVFALQEGGAGTYTWNSATIIACLVVAGLSSIALVIWIWYFSRPGRAIAPLFPARIVTNRVMPANILICTLIGYMFYTVLIELPERFQIVNGTNSQTAGIDLIPLSGASAIGSGLAAVFSSKKNRSFYTNTLGCALALIGAGLIYSLGFDTNIPNSLYGYEVLLGFGIGLTLSSTTIMMKLYANLEDTAPAQGLVAQSRLLGGNIGLAVATIVLNSHLASDLASVLTPTQIHDVRQSLNAVRLFTPEQREAVSRSFADAFKGQMEGVMVVGALAVLVCGLTWDSNPPSFETIMAGTKAKRETEAKALERV